MTSIVGLMHDVSLRSSINRMDAHNLAVVLCPNLVKGQNLAKDVMMCAVSAGASVPRFASTQVQSPEGGRMTLGMTVKLCIERYYEVFDEVQDVAEALTTADRDESVTSTSLDGTSPFVEDEEEIDDAMLVMSIGPSHGRNGSLGGGEPGFRNGTDPNANAGYKVRDRPNMTRNGIANGNGKGFAYATLSKAKSVIGIEKGNGGDEVNGRRGSISVGGRGRRNSKGVGSGVEALGVTAAGFFAPSGERP